MIDDLFNKHKLVRRIIALWAVLLITWVTWRVFGETPPNVPQWTGTTYNWLLVGLIAPIVLYFFHRKKDDADR